MTFEDMKTEMGTWLAVDAIRLPLATRGMIINVCQRELLGAYDLRYGEVTVDIPTEYNKPNYSRPAGWVRPYSLWYYSDGKVNLDYKTKEEFDIIYPDASAKGPPIHYTLWGDYIYLGPTPNGVFSIHVNYRRILPDLADGSPNNTNAFIANSWEVLFFRSLWYATQFIIEDNRAPMWEKMASIFEAKLSIQSTRERSAGRRPVTREAGYVGGPVYSQE
jgi:hypothetical protein